MRLGASIESLQYAQELRRNRKPTLREGGEDLLNAPVEELETLNTTDGSGNPIARFVFGLHSPFDTRTGRWFPGT